MPALQPANKMGQGSHMDEHSNILISGTSESEPSPPDPSRNSKWALASFAAGVATVAGLFPSLTALSLGYTGAAIAFASLHMLFPIAIVCGHVGVRDIRAEGSALKGIGLALAGLNVGYFNLAILGVVVLRFYLAR